jgi:hypothetical protein
MADTAIRVEVEGVRVEVLVRRTARAEEGPGLAKLVVDTEGEELAEVIDLASRRSA